MAEASESSYSTAHMTTNWPGHQSVNGKQNGSANGPNAAELLPITSAYPAISLASCIDAIGCSIASAAVGRSGMLQTADGLRLRAGFSVIIAAENSSPVSAALAHILAPIKR